MHVWILVHAGGHLNRGKEGKLRRRPEGIERCECVGSEQGDGRRGGIKAETGPAFSTLCRACIV